MNYKRVLENESIDYSSIATLYVTLLSQQFSDTPFSQEFIRINHSDIISKIKTMLKSENYFLAVAEDNGRIVGFIEAFFNLYQSLMYMGNNIYIGNFNVSDDYKKQYGISILRNLEQLTNEWGKEKKTSVYVIDVLDFNQSMILAARHTGYSMHTHRMIKCK